MQIVHSADKFCKWHRLPVIIGLVYLLIRRHLYQKYNLFNVEPSVGDQFDPKDYPYRTVDGKYNDSSNSNAGKVETLFGRNVLSVDQKDKVLKNQKVTVFLCWTIWVLSYHIYSNK